MALTQSGFPVLAPDSPRLVVASIAGVNFKVADTFLAPTKSLIRFLHAMEPVTEQGWDGGYAHRKIAGSDLWSDHAGGGAIDWNASQHPRGAALPAGWNDTQVRGIRWYLATAQGSVWHWGADFHTTPDAMHFAIDPHGWADIARNPYR